MNANKLPANFFWQVREFMFREYSNLAEVKLQAGQVELYIVNKEFSEEDVAGAVLLLVAAGKKLKYLPDDFSLQNELRKNVDKEAALLMMLAQIASAMVEVEYQGLISIKERQLYVLIDYFLQFLVEGIDKGQISNDYFIYFKEEIKRPCCALRMKWKNTDSQGNFRYTFPKKRRG